MIKYRRDVDMTARSYGRALYLSYAKPKAIKNLLAEYEEFNEQKINSYQIDCKDDSGLKLYFLEGYRQSFKTIYD